MPSEKEIFLRSHLGNTQFSFSVSRKKNIWSGCFELSVPLHPQWNRNCVLRSLGQHMGPEAIWTQVLANVSQLVEKSVPFDFKAVDHSLSLIFSIVEIPGISMWSFLSFPCFEDDEIWVLHVLKFVMDSLQPWVFMMWVSPASWFSHSIDLVAPLGCHKTEGLLTFLSISNDK